MAKSKTPTFNMNFSSFSMTERRVFIGKLLGFFMGLVSFAYLIQNGHELIFSWGVWGFHILFGAIIGLAGDIKRHPVLHFNIVAPWRGILFGAFIGLVMSAFTFTELETLLAGYENVNVFLVAIIVGTIWGGLVDWIATKYE